MIKEIFAGIKIVLALVAGVLGLLGVRYITIITHTLTSPLYVLIQILIWVVLIIGAIAVCCDWYLRNEPK
jgi:nitrate reductase gamma subunit